MTKDELWSKRTLARRELQDIEEALSLDDHYIDIIEQENTELKSKIDVLETDNYNANCNLALITGKLDQAIDLLRMCQNAYLRDPGLKINVEHFLQETLSFMGDSK